MSKESVNLTPAWDTVRHDSHVVQSSKPALGRDKAPHFVLSSAEPGCMSAAWRASTILKMVGAELGSSAMEATMPVGRTEAEQHLWENASLRSQDAGRPRNQYSSGLSRKTRRAAARAVW